MKGRRKRRGGVVSADRGLSLVALSAGAAGLTAALAGSVLPGLPEVVSQVPAWGLSWGERAVGADAALAGAVAERLAVAAGLLAVVAAQGLFTVVLLLLGERDRRRAPLGVRLALGADPRALVAYVFGRDARRVIAQMGTGVVLGLLAVGAVWATWPGLGLAGATPSDHGRGALALVALGSAGLLLAAVTAGLLSPLVGLSRRTPEILRRGRAVTDDPRAGTVRGAATTFQLAGAVAFALAGLALVRATPVAEGGAQASELSDDPGAPMISRFAVASGTSVYDPLLASPGAWIGVGVRDLVTVECGACVVGVWYLPVYGVDSTVHAVGPAVLDALGAEIVEGRGIEAGDGVGTTLVGVVNESFRQHFEGGEPIGRRIRLSGRGERWVEVVGVVRDPPFKGPGTPTSDQPVLWLALAQHPAVSVEGEAVEGGSIALRAISEPIPLDAFRAAALAPEVWSGWVLLLSGAAALLLALVSALEVGRVEARGMARATAVRLAVGGPPRRLAFRLLARTLRLAGVAVGLGLVVSWVLQAALGGGTITAAALRSSAGIWVALAVLCAAAGGAVPRARALLKLEPARLLRED